MFRRRRKARVLWMPNFGSQTRTDTTPTFPGTNNAGFDFQLSTNISDPTTMSFGLIRDNPESASETGAPLNVIQKQGLNLSSDTAWRCRRIVGKLFLSAGFTTPDAQGNPPADAILLNCGIIVRRVDDDGNPLAAGVDQDVGSLQNNRDPWIWRRDYILGHGMVTDVPNFGQTNLNVQGRQSFPRTNAEYGSVKDGPHIDQKTNRVIGQEERLFFNLTATVLPLFDADNTRAAPIVYMCMQYRIIGQVFKNAGNRRNASR